MDILEAINQVKYPQDRVIGYSRGVVSHPEHLGFNEGWNTLREQLIKIAQKDDNPEVIHVREV